MAGTFFILSYYLPIWFQAVKGVSAVRSGIMNIPLILGVVAASMIAGAGTTILGYYTPFMLASTVIMSIGCGMTTTFTLQTASPAWIGWQAMAGLGVGMGMQLPLIAVQTVLPAVDLPIGTALVVFTQTLGGAIFVSIGQTIFTNKLVENIKKFAPGLEPGIVLSIGATRINQVFTGDDLQGVKKSYNDALTQAFLVALIIAALTIFGSVAMEWRSVKKEVKKDEGGEGGEVQEATESEVKHTDVEIEKSRS